MDIGIVSGIELGLESTKKVGIGIHQTVTMRISCRVEKVRMSLALCLLGIDSGMSSM